MRFVALAFAICIVGAVIGLAHSSAKRSNAAPTFSKDVAPIFQKNCMSCHRPGEIAPMSFLSYKEIRPWARSIREKVASREMPPWHADPKYGEWSNDRRLSQSDVDTIVKWVDAGAPEGSIADLPKLPQFAQGWQIGQPDLIIQMPEEFTVPAEGTVPYTYFTVPSNFKEDRYVEAMEARAGALSVVHHIVIYVREPSGERPKRQDIGTGLLGALSPGMTPFRAAPGQAKLIKAGSNIVFQMHYTPDGKVTKDRSMIGLIFSKKPAEKVITTTAAWDTRFVIPANANNHEVRASFTFDEDAEIVSFMPHMHLRGRDYLYRATYPDGRTEILLSVPKYDFGWQVYYYPKKPIVVPKGTRIDTVAHYDNSKANPNNPDPGVAVRFGEQTWEEMMNGFFDYVTVNKRVSGAAGSGTGN
jgi:hypothetical protein